MYEYTFHNLNLEDSKKAIGTLDRIIVISKDFFPEPEIIKKKIRISNVKKVWIEKKNQKNKCSFYVIMFLTAPINLKEKK